MDCSFRSRFAEENHPDLAPHIEGSHERGNGQEPIHARIMMTCIQQNLILRPEPCKRDNARQRQRSDDVHPESYRHSLAHATHVAHVVRIEHCAVGVTMSAMFRVMMSALDAENDRTR